MEVRTILVAGGAGFIGSHLCDKFLSLGHRVIAVDNYVTGRDKNLKSAFDKKDFVFIEHDITEPLVLDEHIDYIFHLASPASVIAYQTYSEETALTNSVGTLQLLRLAKMHKAGFLLASTSEVYGDPLEHPQKESYWGNVNPNGVRACYDESKRFAEMLTMLHVRKYDMNARIIRIFNTYGPRMDKNDGRVVSNFITQALQGKSMTVYGNGSQTRSFCFISDLIEGIQKAMFAEHTKGEVINLGNPAEFTILELTKKIQEITKTMSTIVFEPLPQDDPIKRRPDITKAKNLLGWEPQIALQDGLMKAIKYYKQELNQ